MHLDETIAAIASSHQGSGVRGIIRVSGPDTIPCCRRIFEAGSRDWESSGRARRVPGHVILADPLGRIPCGLYLWPSGRSYTHQPTAELHTFGARPLLNAILDSLSKLGVRHARPGEFTMRAFLAGRIDLAQAEAILGVIDAVNDRELSVALQQLAGGLSQPLMELRDTLLNLCADLEAGLDFVEEDIEFATKRQVELELTRALSTIEATLSQMGGRDAGEQLPRVVLRGEPNAGKSSLWNALLGQSKAIVTDQAGTTRDYLTATVDRRGARFTLIDTAGVEQPGGTGLTQKIRRKTDGQAANADLVLLCIDSTQPLAHWERAEIERLRSKAKLIVSTKCDLPGRLQNLTPDVTTSTTTEQGMDRLLELITVKLESLGVEASVVASTAVRCRESLRLANESVERALILAQTDAGEELTAAEIRLALEQLGQVVGVIYTDDILDRVFSRFCIGK